MTEDRGYWPGPRQAGRMDAVFYINAFQARAER